MNTLSVRLLYRPLRIGWCVLPNDFDAIRSAIRLSFAMWGGSFNPIIPIGDAELADSLINVFRVDVLMPASKGEAVEKFIAQRTNLPWPIFHGDPLLARGGPSPRKDLGVVDIEHPIRRIYEEFFKSNLAAAPGLDIWEWPVEDPLNNVLLCQYGGMPAAEEVGKDYPGIAAMALIGQRKSIPTDGPLPVPALDRETLASLNRAYTQQHYVVRNFWDFPGFFVGHADDFDDLLTYWNLRAADIQLHFYDPRFPDRFLLLKDFWSATVRREPPRPGRGPGVAVWHQRDYPLANIDAFGQGLTVCAVDTPSWNGMNIMAPIVHFGSESVLASVGEVGSGRPEISFAMTAKPFVESREAHIQRYVLSVDPGTGLFGNERFTLHTPFIPELNEYYGRNCHFIYSDARAEPESLGIITTADTQHMSLRALDVTRLISKVFESVGIKAEPSGPGRICSTLIRRMGGLDDCRPFKIEGVRKLIEDHRPDQSFSRSDAMQAIRGQGETRPLSSYQWLYIEPRGIGTPLTNDAVLGYLLDRGVFRVGLEFKCPGCELWFWRPLDDAKAMLECDLCGHAFNTSRQLRDRDWAFRRSGLFGKDDHQEGAIPVTLALQQLVRLGGFSEGMYTPCLSLSPLTAAISPCETDFAVLKPSGPDHKIEIVIGECKTRKPITADDVTKLKAVADAFPVDRYDTYVVFARLKPFTSEEIDLMRVLNVGSRLRAILLTERELEPYFVYERTQKEFDIPGTAVSFEDMAAVTQAVFFHPKPRQGQLA